MGPNAVDESADLDRTLRLEIYRHFAQTGQAPTMAELASRLSQPQAAVEDSLRRLAAGRAIMLAPGTLNIWMAHPFSAVPTGYPVQAAERSYWANCAWDALNLTALLGIDSHIVAACPDCNTPLSMTVEHGSLRSPEGVIHFAVPPRHFWDNIGFT